MDIKINVQAYENKKEDDYYYKSEVDCEITQDEDNEELIKLEFGYGNVYYVNAKELSKAIDILT